MSMDEVMHRYREELAKNITNHIFPLVSVIMPTANRAHLLPLAIENFLKQDYSLKSMHAQIDELIIVGDNVDICMNELGVFGYKAKHIQTPNNYTIGQKLNIGASQAKGNVHLIMNDDDFYAPNWISKSVDYLLLTGAELTGLSSAYFLKQPDQLYRYQYENKLPPFKPYVLGATMCYLKSYWENHKFKEQDPERPNQPLRTGEDWYFSLDCENIVPHEHINDFTAIIHGGNTSSGKNLNNKAYTPTSIEHLHNIMGADIEKYITLQGKSS